ncbi:MAG: hypothetical protein EZS28_003369 [Streblomastix strix]|uniref:Uncharacterized protein n=1 Tax=Streblomastix strix TaxID=222440 RepID=A0A5J4X1P0_9EUKA|nr:MAG: hypothetical protein EZS28_003369 [Streblomastix strix]
MEDKQNDDLFGCKHGYFVDVDSPIIENIQPKHIFQETKRSNKIQTLKHSPLDDTLHAIERYLEQNELFTGLIVGQSILVKLILAAVKNLTTPEFAATANLNLCAIAIVKVRHIQNCFQSQKQKQKQKQKKTVKYRGSELNQDSGCHFTR